MFQFIKCSDCEKTFLVGINGKDIRNAGSSGRDEEFGPYRAFGQGEIEAAPKLADELPCPECGKMCTVDWSD